MANPQTQPQSPSGVQQYVQQNQYQPPQQQPMQPQRPRGPFRNDQVNESYGNHPILSGLLAGGLPMGAMLLYNMLNGNGDDLSPTGLGIGGLASAALGLGTAKNASKYGKDRQNYQSQMGQWKQQNQPQQQGMMPPPVQSMPPMNPMTTSQASMIPQG